MPLRPVIAWLCLCLALAPGVARGFETKAREALVVDHATGIVLFAKDADRPMPPASMSKLMTLYMLFEALRDERVTRETLFNVSARAQAMGGSRMFVEAGTQVPVEALIHGIIVASGNDACVVVAEGLAGTEEEFAEQMTARARELGMAHTTLKNSSGWPEEGHAMSAEDLVILSRRIIADFPEFYAYFKETEFTWNDITQPNRNPLLKPGIGADGLKTGHTEAAGYGLVGSAVQNGQRIVFVVSGLASVSERAAETEVDREVGVRRLRHGAVLRRGRRRDRGRGLARRRGDRAAGRSGGAADAGAARSARRGRGAGGLRRPGRGAGRCRPEARRARVEVPGSGTAIFDLVAGRAVARGGLLTRINAAARLTRDRAIGLLPGRD